MVELAMEGRTPAKLSREFDCSAQTIINWVARAAADSGKPLAGKDVLSTVEREELMRLPRRCDSCRWSATSWERLRPGSQAEPTWAFHAVFELMNANQDSYPLRTMYRTLNVSTSGYYAWRHRAPSARAIGNAVLTERIRSVHAESDATYGMPRVRAELRDQGLAVSRKRVARLMRQHGIRGVSRRRAWCVTTPRDKRQRPAPDLVERKFVANGPNQLWVADTTYVPTWAGFIYLAVVLDVWSRRIVGWAIGEPPR